MTGASRHGKGLGAKGLAGVLILTLTVLALAGPSAAQGFFSRGKPAAPATAADNSARLEPILQAVDQAISEQRLVDASNLIERAMTSGSNAPALHLRMGELQLLRERYEPAINSFETAAADPALKARALQGKGLALISLNRSPQALESLDAAVAADPSLWRAWNALGVERDRRKDFKAAEQAYDNALKAPAATGAVYNNRGYSRLLQGRYDEASTDFVAALEKDPGLALARTNLRLSLALRGDYRRATSVSASEDRAAVLNNAGYAAMLRGEYDDAEKLFQQAIEARGNTYGRAFDNLQMVKVLRADQAKEGAKP